MSIHLPLYVEEELKVPITVKNVNTHLHPKGISASGFQRAWSQNLTGKGIIVSIIDTGVDETHKDLSGSVIKSFNLTNEDKLTSSHGTHVAGTICAHGYIYGGAPRCSIISIKAISSAGGNIDSLIKSIEISANQGAHIINMSIGTTDLSNDEQNRLSKAVKYAWDKGSICVAAAGNDGKTICSNDAYSYPASLNLVESVAACDVGTNLNTIHITYFSNENDKVKEAACGYQVISTVMGNTYAVYSGTSMAAPHVSAMAAILAETLPESKNKNRTGEYSQKLITLLKHNILPVAKTCQINKTSVKNNVIDTFQDVKLFQGNKILSPLKITKKLECKDEDNCELPTNNVQLSIKNSKSNTIIKANNLGSNKINKSNESNKRNGLANNQINTSFGSGFVRYQPQLGAYKFAIQNQAFYSGDIFLGHLSELSLPL